MLADFHRRDRRSPFGGALPQAAAQNRVGMSQLPAMEFESTVCISNRKLSIKRVRA
jgi:hypothetical protein